MKALSVDRSAGVPRKDLYDGVRMSDKRYVQGDSPDLTSDIEGLHSLLGEEKQHVQGRVTGSEYELII